jgi:hypothetical protein
MRTNAPENAHSTSGSPDGIEAAEETRIEVNRSGKPRDAAAPDEGATRSLRRDGKYAPVDAARRTSDTDRRV